MKKHLLAIALGTFAAHAAAEQTYYLDDIVVTAKRFEETDSTIATNIVVLTRDEIAHSAANSLPELLQRFAGLNVRSLYGTYPASVDIDARGFGENGSSHVLVLLDGRRLNAIDSNAVENWSAIPLSRIERVEVLYGSGTVLYGDNAVGAVINIITNGDTSPSRQVSVRAGSFNTREGSVGLNGRAGEVGYSLNAQLAHTDSYRDHNVINLANLDGRLGLPQDRLFAEFGFARHDTGLPAYLTMDENRADPTASYEANGNGWARQKTWYIRPGTHIALGPDADLRAELGYDESRLRSFLPAWAASDSAVDTRIRTLSFTPRINIRKGLADMATDSVLGVDVYRTDYDSDRATAPDLPPAMTTGMRVDSQAVYLQSSLLATERLTATAGARRQWVDQKATRDAGSLTNDQARNALELGLSYQTTPDLRLFARHGSTFRFAKTDELTTMSGLGIALRPEHGLSSDAGLEWKHGGQRVQVGVYRVALRDEIAYNADPDGNPSTYDGRNENLDATRHQGFTLDGRFPVTGTVTLRGGYAYTDARFTDGAGEGRQLALVPKHKASLGLGWTPSAQWDIEATLQYVGKRNYSVSDAADLGNNRLPAYATFDLAATWQEGPWTVQLAGKNLANRHYFSTGYDWSSAWGPFFAVYPNDGRAAFLSIAYSEVPGH